jgi:hypothetical protein
MFGSNVKLPSFFVTWGVSSESSVLSVKVFVRRRDILSWRKGVLDEKRRGLDWKRLRLNRGVVLDGGVELEGGNASSGSFPCDVDATQTRHLLTSPALLFPI